MYKFLSAIKRLFRVAIAGATSAVGVQVVAAEAEDPAKLIITVVLTSIISAIGKYLREKLDLRTPF